ncbi:MAG: hypothetical protein AAF687_09765 [Pseudomonadota bacterium]
MNYAKPLAMVAACVAISACGGSGETAAETDTAEASGETAEDSAPAQAAGAGGEYVSCLLNVPTGPEKKHFVSLAAPAPAGADQESLEADFTAKLKADHGVDGTLVAICNLGDQSSVERGQAYTTGRSEERGMTTVEVEFP